MTEHFTKRTHWVDVHWTLRSRREWHLESLKIILTQNFGRRIWKMVSIFAESRNQKAHGRTIVEGQHVSFCKHTVKCPQKVGIVPVIIRIRLAIPGVKLINLSAVHSSSCEWHMLKNGVFEVYVRVDLNTVFSPWCIDLCPLSPLLVSPIFWYHRILMWPEGSTLVRGRKLTWTPTFNWYRIFCGVGEKFGVLNKSIPGEFLWCSSRTSIYVPCEALESSHLPRRLLKYHGVMFLNFRVLCTRLFEDIVFCFSFSRAFLFAQFHVCLQNRKYFATALFLNSSFLTDSLYLVK